MKRQRLLLACLLWIVVGTGACCPIVVPTAIHPTLQLVSHVAGPALTVAVQDGYAYLGFSTIQWTGQRLTWLLSNSML